MNLEEGAYWVNSLFPVVLGFRRVDDFHVGCANLGDSQQLACSADFGRVDTGLITQDQGGQTVEVRSELFTIGRVDEIAAARVVGAAAAFLRAAKGSIPAQPGSLIPGLGVLAELDEKFTVRHGLLSVPYVWGREVPQMTEAAGDVHGEETGEAGRLTVMLQIILLTDDERDFALTYGIGDLQQELTRTGVDLLDWQR